MSTQSISHLKAVFRDVLSPSSKSYYILVHSQSIEFVRISGRNSYTTLLMHYAFDSQEGGFRRFCENLCEAPCYFGQPVTILLDNCEVFTYFKRLGTLRPSQILESLKIIQSDETVLSHAVVRSPGSRIFAAHGARSGYLEAILAACSKTGLRVVDITTLPMFLFHRLSLPQANSGALLLFCFPGGAVKYAIIEPNGSILWGQEERQIDHAEISPLIDRLERTYFGTDSNPQRCLYGMKSNLPGDQYEYAEIAGLFTGKLRSQRVPSLVQDSLESSLAARALQVSSNSLRLLVWILAVVSVVLGAATAITGEYSSDTEMPIKAFQQKYASKILFEQTLDSLSLLHARITASVLPKSQVASVVSVFCQKFFPGLYLERIAIMRIPHDTTLVEIGGIARDEPLVFDYHRYVNSLADSIPVTIKVVKPELQYQDGKSDTVVAFSFSMVLDASQNKE